MRDLLGGLEIFKNEHSETLFPEFLETECPFSRQGWSSLKFSLKSKIFNENGQMVGMREGETRQHNFQLLSLHT